MNEVQFFFWDWSPCRPHLKHILKKGPQIFTDEALNLCLVIIRVGLSGFRFHAFLSPSPIKKGNLQARILWRCLFFWKRLPSFTISRTSFARNVLQNETKMSFEWSVKTLHILTPSFLVQGQQQTLPRQNNNNKKKRGGEGGHLPQENLLRQSWYPA